MLSDYTFLKNRVNLWSLRRFCSDSQRIFLYRLFIETSLVAPVAILAASFCILSSSFFLPVCNYPICYPHILVMVL